MKIHPFCGGKITSKLKLLIAFDMIVSAVVLQIAVIGIFFKAGLHYKMISPSDNYSKNESLIGLDFSAIVIFILFLIIDIMLDVWLWIIVLKKDKSRAQVWFVMKMTLELCDALGFSVEVIFGQHTAVYIVPMIMDFIFTGFFLWTVFIFMAEINKAATATKTVLESNKFVKFFKSGHRHSIVGDEETALKSVMDD